MHWGLDDPAAVVEFDREVRAFERTFRDLSGLIERLIEVAVTNVDHDVLPAGMQQIHNAAA